MNSILKSLLDHILCQSSLEKLVFSLHAQAQSVLLYIICLLLICILSILTSYKYLFIFSLYKVVPRTGRERTYVIGDGRGH